MPIIFDPQLSIAPAVHTTPLYLDACPKMQLTAWEQWMPIQHAWAIDMLSRDMPKDVEIEIDVDDHGYGDITFESDTVRESRSFDMDQKRVRSGFIELQRKGKGIGRNIMRNEIEFFAACGLKRFEIYAGLSAGGYTWARFGFLPDTENDKIYKMTMDSLSQEVGQRYSVIASLLPAGERVVLEQAVQFNETTDLWRVADARFNIRPRLLEAFNKASSAERSLLAYVVSNAENISMRQVKNNLKSKKPLPAGRLLLAGTSWDGEMNFDNEEQMARVEKYVGGFQRPLGTRPGRRKL